MKKLNYLTILLSALLVSGSVWGGMPEPEPVVPMTKFVDQSKQIIGNLTRPIVAQKTPMNSAEVKSPIRKSINEGSSYPCQLWRNKSLVDSFEYFNYALSAAQDGDVIKLIDDSYAQAEDITKSITIDLQGHELINNLDPTNYPTYYWAVAIDADNVIIKNGAIRMWYNFSSSYGLWVYSGSVVLENVDILGYSEVSGYESYRPTHGIRTRPGTTTTINGGSILGATGSVYSEGTCVINSGTFGKYIDNYGELTINNGIFNGVIYSNETDDVININNGTFNTTVYHTGGIMNITGGTFEAGNSSNYVYGGTLNISGGTFSSSYKYGTFYLWNYYNPIKVDITGSPVFVCENDGSETWTAGCLYGYTNDVISIKGGTFVSNNIACYARNSKYVVEGGTFYATPYYTFYSGASGSISLQGGKCNSNARADFGAFVASGYALSKPEDGWYSVVKSVVTLNGVGYPTIAAALEDANPGETLYLIDNIEGNVDITKSVHFNLSTKSISGCLSASNNSNVLIHGTGSSDVGSFAAVAGSTIKIDRGTFTNKPEDQFVADGCQVVEVSGKWQITAGEVIALNINGGETIKCTTFKAALDSITAATNKAALMNPDTVLPSLITFLKNFTDYGNNEIVSGRIITIDLNGCKMSSASQPNDTYALINNKGTLTIKDSKDTMKKGLGGGELQTSDLGADMKFCPRYATNVITNYGTIYMESGRLTSFGGGTASYAVDNQAPHSAGDVKLIVEGGKIVSEGTSKAIRMYLSSGNNNVIDIQNAYVSSVWAQDADANSRGYLNIENSTIDNGISLGYVGAATKLTVHLKNDTIENGSFNSVIALDPLSLAQDTTFSIDNCRFKTYIHTDYFKHLTNGQFQFKNDVFKAYGRNSTMMAEYPESEGYYYVPLQGTENYVQVYRYVQANFREFIRYIEDGYYLRLMSGVDGENLWYEIVQLKPTNPSAEPETGLGHPWHQDTTWDSDSTNVIPQDTDAVLIDHNVYVEADSIANANSIIVTSGDTLRILSGGELHVGGAGINLEDETAEIIVEPDAILTVGAAGVIADSVQNIVIESSGDTTGIFLLNPDVDINTQPKGTVEMVAHVGKRNGNNVWHRFALPVVKLDAAWTKEPSRSTYLYEWSYTEKSWVLTEGGSLGMKPFFGYTISTDYPVENVKYTFIGNLLGNQGSNIDFTHIGYGYFGNSYTGHIYAQTLLNDVFELEGVEGTVWMWNTANQSYSGVSLEDYSGSAAEDLEDFEKNVSPMQTFILKLNSGDGTNMDIDYAAAIWGNPRYGLVEANAPSRKEKVQNDAYANIIITSANGNSDKVRLTESAKYSDEYENGIDAPKYMNSGSINLYVTADGGDFTSLYSNNLQGKRLTLKTLDEVSYTLTIGHVEGGKYAIKDLLTNKVVAMENNATYTFAAQPNTTMERFEIVEARQLPTSVDQVQDFKETNGIYSILGQYIGETSNWEMLPKGVYVVDGVKLVK